MAAPFDPKKFINRDFEYDLFTGLLTLGDDKRILAIRDKGNMGKSHLLEKLRHHCFTEPPRTPVSLIPLDQLAASQPHKLVERLVDDLSKYFGLQFPSYRNLKLALESGDLLAIRGWIDARNANLSGASDIRFIGVNIEGASTVNVHNGHPVLTPNQQSSALEACIEGFFADLQDICAKRTVVVILDAYDKCEDNLANWITSAFLQWYFFDLAQRPKRLLLVVAGRDVPPFDLLWTADEIDTVVGSIRQLGTWKREHVEQCLQAHGYKYTTEQLDQFFSFVQQGVPPGTIVQLIRDLAAVAV